ncbi:MAG: insulinase family protein, partial [Clostridia bacterium]|nr:insulinase family protein [Clostridia bacterium]
MKKTLALILALCLAMTSFVFAGAEEETALPAVGDVVYGFEVKEIREFPMIDAQIVRFEHQKTGAELFYIANDDTNRVFDLTFFTDAIDRTGLPHVFEHSTLDGSEKYPSKALFFNLSYQTYNTYMNAFTMDRLTSYPVASLSEAQLLKYADYYTDSCLHPMILEDESIFREEAWRYRLESEDAPLTIEGTVYSEMMGATTQSSAAYMNSMKVTFPGSMVGNEYGGFPAYIPDMTWEM